MAPKPTTTKKAATTKPATPSWAQPKLSAAEDEPSVEPMAPKVTTTKKAAPATPATPKATTKKRGAGLSAEKDAGAPPKKKGTAKKVSNEAEDVVDPNDGEAGCSVAEQERRAEQLLQKEGKLTVEEVLHCVEVSPIPESDGRKNVMPEGFTKVRGCALGLLTSRNGGGVVVSNRSEAWPKFTEVLCRFMKEEEPEFKFTTIQVNKNYAAKRHTDSNNLGDSRLIALGDFTGGNLLVEEKGKLRREKVRNTWVGFNGNNPHEVTEFEGTRFSFVFFTLGNYRELTTETADRLKELGFTVPSGEELAEWMKEQIDAKKEKSGTAAIQKEVDRLKKALPEEAAKWPAVKADEVQLVSAGYDIAVHDPKFTAPDGSVTKFDIARIQTAKETWCIRGGMMVTLLNPSDLTLNEEAHPKDKKGKQEGKFLSFYKDTPQATKDFVKLAKTAIDDGLVICMSAADTVVKQNVVLPDAFYDTLKRLGYPQDPERIGYRRPFAMIAYKGEVEFAHAGRLELLRLVVQVQPETGTLSLQTKERVNMCPDVKSDEGNNGMPLAPTFSALTAKDSVARKANESWRVVIPSYDRPEKLKAATLELLKTHGVPLERIFVFVANEAELRRYLTALGDQWKHTEDPTSTRKGKGNVVLGVLRIRPQREFIAKFFPEGQYLVSLDDDVTQLEYCSAKDDSSAIHPLPKGELQKLISHGGDLMLRAKAKLWSVNTSQNSLNMHPTHISRRAGVCNGYCYGFINRPDLDSIYPQLDDAAEDVERSARYFQTDGVVLRYRMLRAATRCYDEKGGLQTLFGDTKKRKAAELKHVEDLAKQFPNLLCVNEVRAAKQTGGDSDHRSLPVHFVNVGDPPLEGKVSPWKHPVGDIKVSKVGMVTERVENLAGRR